MSNGIADVRVGELVGSDRLLGEPSDRLRPSSGTSDSSSSARPPMRAAASAKAPGAGVDVTVSCMSRRTAAASSSRPPPLHGRPAGPFRRGASSGSGGSGRPTGDRHRHRGLRTARRTRRASRGRPGPPTGCPRHPQDHLVDPEPAEVLELGIGGDRPEREHPRPRRVTTGLLEGPAERGERLSQPRAPDGHPPVPVLGDGGEVGRRRRRRRAGRARRLPVPAWAPPARVEVDELAVELGRVVAPQGPHAQDVLAGDGRAGRRRRPRGRPPRRGSTRTRCRARTAPRSGGRAWRPAWPARSGRAGPPGPRPSRAAARRDGHSGGQGHERVEAALVVVDPHPLDQGRRGVGPHRQVGVLGKEERGEARVPRLPWPARTAPCPGPSGSR